jgi:hypothetical protein
LVEDKVVHRFKLLALGRAGRSASPVGAEREQSEEEI